MFDSFCLSTVWGHEPFPIQRDDIHHIWSFYDPNSVVTLQHDDSHDDTNIPKYQGTISNGMEETGIELRKTWYYP